MESLNRVSSFMQVRYSVHAPKLRHKIGIGHAGLSSCHADTEHADTEQVQRHQIYMYPSRFNQ